MRGKSFGLLVLAVGVGVAAGGIAYASIPDSKSVIHGCCTSRRTRPRLAAEGGGVAGSRILRKLRVLRQDPVSHLMKLLEAELGEIKIVRLPAQLQLLLRL